MGWPFQKATSIHLSTKHGKLTGCQYDIKQWVTLTRPFRLSQPLLAHQYLFPALLRGRSSVITVCFCLYTGISSETDGALLWMLGSLWALSVEPLGSAGPGFSAWPADMLPAPEVYGDLLLVGDSSLQCGWKSCLCCLQKKKSVGKCLCT